MQKIVLTLVLLAITPIMFAQTTEELSPDTEQNRDSNLIYSSSPKINRRSEDSLECEQLRKKMEELKGYPQRRYAAAQQYQAQCVSQ